MSRTDIHRPLYALWLDPGMREHFKEQHDHSAGPCDLELFLATLRRGGWARTRCLVQWWSEKRICGCPLCTGQSGRKRARRQERHDTRRALHDAAAQVAGEDLDEDLPGPYRAAAW